MWIYVISYIWLARQLAILGDKRLWCWILPENFWTKLILIRCSMPNWVADLGLKPEWQTWVWSQLSPWGCFQVKACQWLNFVTPVAALPGARHYRVSTGTGCPGVSMLWVDEIASLICKFCLSLAAGTIVRTDLSWRFTSMMLGCWATSQHPATTFVVAGLLCRFVKSQQHVSVSHVWLQVLYVCLGTPSGYISSRLYKSKWWSVLVRVTWWCFLDDCFWFLVVVVVVAAVMKLMTMVVEVGVVMVVCGDIQWPCVWCVCMGACMRVHVYVWAYMWWMYFVVW